MDGKVYRGAMSVVCMGDQNGVAFAQETHEYMLRDNDLLQEGQVM